MRVSIPGSVLSNASLPPGTTGTQISRAELEDMFPGSDDYGTTVVEFFLVLESGREPEVLSYLPASKTWERLSYGGRHDRTYWSQVS